MIVPRSGSLDLAKLYRLPEPGKCLSKYLHLNNSLILKLGLREKAELEFKIPEELLNFKEGELLFEEPK